MSKQYFFKRRVGKTDVFGIAGIYEGIGIHQRKRRRRAVHKVSKMNAQKRGYSIEMAKGIYQIVHR